MNAARTIKRNAYGNIRGYIGRSLEVEFGSDAIAAAYWRLTGIVDFDASYGDDLETCKKVALQYLDFI